MGYKKYKADQLFNGYDFEDPDQVLILTDKGIVENIIPRHEAGEDVREWTGILSPGFVNVHCHLELSHLKGLIPKNTGLVDFVYKVVTERHFNQDEILNKIASAEQEMIHKGIVAVGDICNNILTINQKRKENISYHNFIEVSGWIPEIAKARFEKSKTIESEFLNYFPATSLVPHAPYSVSEKLWDLLIPEFKNNIISIHNQETFAENQFFLNGTGDLKRMYDLMNMDTSFFQPTTRNSLPGYFHKLKSAKNIILVHNTFTNQEDLDDIIPIKKVEQSVWFCICINANLYIENKIPPIKLLRHNNCNMVLGTDSLASNDQLDILEEIKTILKNFPDIPTAEILKWATSNGAKALGLDPMLGSFEKGKQPGIVLIDKLENGNITSNSTSIRLR